MRRAVALGLLGALAAAGPGEQALADLRARWAKLDRAGKADGLVRLGLHPSPAVLAQARKWLDDDDPVVRGHVVRLIATCCVDPALADAAVSEIAAYGQRYLDARARREKEEFEAVCRKHGRKVPPGNVTQAGPKWQDPWDERRRPLPDEIRDERAHAIALVGAVESTRAEALRPLLARLFAEHHDPEVLLRLVACFRKWKEWRALPALADLVRIQMHGRAIGGGDVIGNESYAVLRLKWDVHKDRLWWSRPEYVPRTARPILAAASEIVGAELGSARALDGWLLAHEAELARHGVRLSAAFRARARETQGGDIR